jgi:hypothetical protein
VKCIDCGWTTPTEELIGRGKKKTRRRQSGTPGAASCL